MSVKSKKLLKRRRLLEAMPKPAKGKARVKITASGKKVSYGQAGLASDGKRRVRPSSAKGDAYCARSAGQLRRSSAKTRNDPNSRIRQARRSWKC